MSYDVNDWDGILKLTVLGISLTVSSSSQLEISSVVSIALANLVGVAQTIVFLDSYLRLWQVLSHFQNGLRDEQTHSKSLCSKSR